MIRRRKALKNIGLLTGGMLSIPYSCNIIPEISYTNLPLISSEQQELIAVICNLLLPNKSEAFPTPESREHFVLSMVNDCLDAKERIKFLNGFKTFQIELLKKKERPFKDAFLEDQVDFIAQYINKKNSEIGLFLNHLKHYSILHFETSENYMKSYLNFEFMPGRYQGTVLVKS
jgi:galactose-1-phosphate uridylyltransferase